MLNHEEIKKDPQRIAKRKPFTNKYNWEGIIFHQIKMIGKNNVKIALNVLYAKKKNTSCLCFKT